ncbi:MAG: polysaccharide biosynthesis protein, partial [Anaerolineales bacterium]
VPIFQEQIAMGGPITVTHPDVTRFFMTIPEAVQLVLQAASMGSAGDTYVLDMGEAVKIVDLVKDMVEISGYKLGEDIEIIYTGLRPGEKLFEELFTKNEQPNRTEHEKIFVASSHNEANYDKLYQQLEELNELLTMGNTKILVEKLNHLVSDM